MALGSRTARFLSSSTSSSSAIPLLWKAPEAAAASPPPSNVQLLSWGRGSAGQLGGGKEEIRYYPTPVASLLLPPDFRLSPVQGRLLPPAAPVHQSANGGGEGGVEVGVSCGLFHSALLVDGRFWVWGKGDGGRLGLGHEEPAFVPVLNPNLDGVRSIALGGVHSTALTRRGEVYTWGYGGFGALGHSVYHRELLPRLVGGDWSGKITHLSTSGAHTAVVSDTGDDAWWRKSITDRKNDNVFIMLFVGPCGHGIKFWQDILVLPGEAYTWGRDEGDGRLGLGSGGGPGEGGSFAIPSKVLALPMPIKAICCGGFFTMALTSEGKLWSWGANSNFELGRGNNVSDWRPQPVSCLEDVCIVQISCGGYHSLALTDKGKVLSWGHGGHGQLGHHSAQSQKVPMIIEALSMENVVHIACGGSSSAAVTDQGKLYMWGNARDCQLGIPGLPDVQSSPMEVKFVTEDDDLGSHHVFSVSVGASHAMCLVLRKNT